MGRVYLSYSASCAVKRLVISGQSLGDAGFRTAKSAKGSAARLSHAKARRMRKGRANVLMSRGCVATSIWSMRSIRSKPESRVRVRGQNRIFRLHRFYRQFIDASSPPELALRAPRHVYPTAVCGLPRRRIRSREKPALPAAHEQAAHCPLPGLPFFILQFCCMLLYYWQQHNSSQTESHHNGIIPLKFLLRCPGNAIER